MMRDRLLVNQSIFHKIHHQEMRDEKTFENTLTLAEEANYQFQVLAAVAAARTLFLLWAVTGIANVRNGYLNWQLKLFEV